MTTLRARHVVRAYGERRPVDGVSLEVRGGEMLGLIGPNGGGKTTLLHLLAGLVTPDEGDVLLDDERVDGLATRASGAIGLVTTEAGLYPLLTGRENLHFFGGLYGQSEAAVDASCEGWLTALDVSADIDRPAASYSAGTRQKISLIRALMQKPRLLLLDEPTANLDPMAATTILEAARAQANAGVAVVLCTHDLHAAASVCDRVVAHRGKIQGEERNIGPSTSAPVLQLERLFRLAVDSATPPQVPQPQRDASTQRRSPLMGIVRREILEQRRQPAMLAVIGLLFLLVTGLPIALLIGVEQMVADPQIAATLAELSGVSAEAALQPLRDGLLQTAAFLAISQLFGVSAVLAGQSILHERQHATLPFLLLAPVRRAELLLGKIAGAFCWAIAMYSVITILSFGGHATLRGGESPVDIGAWLVALAVGAPAWAFAVSAAGVCVSAAARDVRTAQQSVWFIVFLATLGPATWMTATLSWGFEAQCLQATTAVALAGLLLSAGTALLRRDLSR
jgi:ABC-type multidrug transport system ATPase subunit/ABC-type transport system involved in multi-copper enzyme maturation permease subunit